MTQTDPDDIERLGTLLAALPPVPAGLVAAAKELPSARRSLDELLTRAEADAELRAKLVSDLESALAAEGIEPAGWALDEAKERMRDF
jgi:hypothetical protein